MKKIILNEWGEHKEKCDECSVWTFDWDKRGKTIKCYKCRRIENEKASK